MDRMPDKVTLNDIADRMAASVSREIAFHMDALGQDYATARGFVKMKTVAGKAIWDAVDAQHGYTHQDNVDIAPRLPL